jgi:molecular chaperone GrpE (heat shock protein)
MVRHDHKSMSEGELQSRQEPGAPDPAESAAHADKLRAQLESSQRLNEYYNQVVAEIRASLERAESEVS